MNAEKESQKRLFCVKNKEKDKKEAVNCRLQPVVDKLKGQIGGR